MATLREARSLTESSLSEAESFLQPVLKREDFARAKASSIVDKLFEASGALANQGQTKQVVVVAKALSLLEGIQISISSDEALTTEVLNTSSSRRLIDALLDLISLEGIYPFLLPGVGSPIERRVQSVLQGGVTITDVGKDQSSHVGDLGGLTEHLYALAMSSRGVALAIQQRVLVDLIAAMTQLAYGPSSIPEDQWSGKLKSLIDSLSPAILFPSLISLLHSTTPSWLRPHIVVPLSLLPMRKDGVRQTIAFVAKSTPQRPAHNVAQSGGSNKGPTLPIEVLAQISKVLSAVPATVSAVDYFKSVGDQLLKLLDDQDPDTQRAAAYTISYGILSKRQTGQPGSVGWDIFIEPLISVINPSVSPGRTPARSSLQLCKALRTMSALTLLFLNPALSKRILGPIVLPLWAIVCVSNGKSTENGVAFKLLEHYINTVAGSKSMILIVDSLMYDGDSGWTITSTKGDADTSSASVTVRVDPLQLQYGTRAIDIIQERIAKFQRLLDALQDNTEFGLFFTELLKRVLKQQKGTSQNPGYDMVQPVIYVTIARSLISTKSFRLMNNTSSIISLMEEILSSQFAALQSHGLSNGKIISKSDLSNIVSNEEQDGNQEAMQDLENSLNICLPWLLLIMQADDRDHSKSDKAKLATMEVLLNSMTNDPRIPRLLRRSVSSVVDMLENTSTHSKSQDMAQMNDLERDTDLYAISIKNLQAEEAPIRVQGLSQLETLIYRSSPLVSTESAVLNAVSLLQDPDSFVYLSSIKFLTKLAKRESRVVIKVLEEAFLDVTEQGTLDVRLRIGEALQTIVEEIGPELSPSIIIRLSEALLYLASRRVYRSKSDQAQNLAVAAPRISEVINNESDSDADDEMHRSDRDLQAILDSWQGKAGAEDQRIRSSALTILASVFEHSDPGVTRTFMHPVIALVMQILQHEKDQENAIVRRAAVLVISSILKGQRNIDRRTLLAAGQLNGDVPNIDVVLQELAVGDADDVVRGHAENMLQAIQEWKQETMDDLMRGQDIRFGLADNTGNVRLQGLDVHPRQPSDAGRSRKPKIEELD